MWKKLEGGSGVLSMWTQKHQGAAYSTIVLHFLLTLFSFGFIIKCQSSSFAEDYACLVSFKSGIQDPQSLLSSWTARGGSGEDSGASPCNGSISSWHGVTCDNNRVFSLILPNLGLHGEISPNLSKCSALGTLDLSSNRLTGGIPSSLGELPNLVSLNLSQNELTGEIPAQLGNCSYLNALDLHANVLGGTIPEELGNLARLQEFDVSDNGLSGQIPTVLSYNVGGSARFNASSFDGNRALFGFPLPNAGNGHTLSLVEIIGIGLASGVFSLTVSFTAVCLWLKISEQHNAAEEGRISELMSTEA